MGQPPSEKNDAKDENRISSWGLLWRWMYMIALQVILFKDVWLNLFHSGAVRSWDGSSHYAAASIVNSTIYPDTFGWTNAFLGGMPLPNYYSPLLFWLTALLAHLGIKFDAAFKIVALVPTLFIIPCLWLLAYRLFGKRVAFWTAVSAFLQMTVPQLSTGFQWPSGLDYMSIFVSGFYAQSLGFVLLLFWYVLYAGIRWSPARHLVGAVLLALSLLANYLAVIVAAMAVLATLTVELAAILRFKQVPASASSAQESKEARAALLHHCLSPVLSLGLIAFWLLPVITTYSFVVTRPMHVMVVSPVQTVAAGIALVGGFLAWRKASRAARPYILLCAGLAGLSLCATVAPRWFPLQENRLAATVRLLATVLAGVFFSVVVEQLKRLWRRFIAGARLDSARRMRRVLADPARVLLGLLLIMFYARSPEMKIYSRICRDVGFYAGNIQRGIATFGAAVRDSQAASDPFGDFGREEGERSLHGILQFAKTHTDGRYLVALPNNGYTYPSFDAQAISLYLGIQGNESIYAAYREASVNSLFFYPQMDAFSSNADAALRYGISSTLADDVEFLDQPLSVHLERARWLGVRYLVVYDDELKKRLKAEQNVTEAQQFGPWSVFVLEGWSGPKVEVLRYLPALVISTFTAKLRRSDEHSFLRLAEEQFYDNWFEVPLVYSPSTRLDLLNKEMLDHFGAIIVERYDYDNYTFFTILKQLQWFAQTRPVILLPQDNRMFYRIRKTLSNFPHAVVLGADMSEPGVPLGDLYGPMHHFTQSSIRAEWRQIRRTLEANKVPVASGAQAPAVRVDGDRSNELTISPRLLSGQASVPLLLRITYHPRWKTANGSPIYATTPFFSLVFAGSDVHLQFARNGTDKTSLLFSALCLAGIIGWAMIASLNRVLRSQSKFAFSKTE